MLEGKKCLVIGSGISGIGAAVLLEKNHADVVLYDSSDKLTGEDLKAKLPEGVYPIGIHYYHWASMAAAANGVIQIDSDGNINFNQEGFIEAMSFYKELIDEGLACPIEVEKNEDGDYSDVTCYYSTQDMADQKFVIGRIEAWQAGGLADSIGEWGVTMWP